MKRRSPRGVPPDPLETNPHWERWLSLTPQERLRRSWRLRRLLRDPAAVHDAKSIPRI